MKGYRQLLIAIILLSLVGRVYFSLRPLDGHEALFAQPAEELLANQRLEPTYLGTPIFYKPPLSFYTYAAFIGLFSWLPAPIELIYRLQPLFFGALSIYLVYLLVKKLFDEDIALISCTAYAVSNLAIFIHAEMNSDSLLNFLVLASILFYVRGGRKDLAFGWLFSAFAYLTKTSMSFAIPVIAIAYALTCEKKRLRDPVFLASLSGPLFGLLVWMLFFNHGGSGGVGGQVEQDIFRRFTHSPYSVLVSFFSFTALFAPWIIASVIGILGVLRRQRDGKENFFLWWTALGVIPLFSDPISTSYIMPILPAFSFFAAMGIDDEKDARLRTALLVLFFVGTLPLFAIQANPVWESYSERDVGTYIANEPGVLLITRDPLNCIVFYKHKAEGMGNYVPVSELMRCKPGGSYDCLKIFDYNWSSISYYVIENDGPLLFLSRDSEFIDYNISETRLVVVSQPLEAFFLRHPESKEFSLDRNFSGYFLAYRRTSG